MEWADRSSAQLDAYWDSAQDPACPPRRARATAPGSRCSRATAYASTRCRRSTVTAGWTPCRATPHRSVEVERAGEAARQSGVPGRPARPPKTPSDELVWMGSVGLRAQLPNSLSQRPIVARSQRQPSRIRGDMRVAIDARKLHDFGIGTYIRNLLRHLARIDHDTEYVLLCGEADLGVAAQLGRTSARCWSPRPTTPSANRFTCPGCCGASGPISTMRRTTCCRRRSTAARSSRSTTAFTLMFPYLPNRMAYAYARADVDGRAPLGLHPDGVRRVQARHPPPVQHSAREDRGRVQRHRRALLGHAAV